MSDFSGNLNELFEYKNSLMQLLCSDEAIVRLVMYKDDNPAVPNRDMPYRNVFPYNFTPEITKESSVFVCFDVETRRVPNDTVLYYDVYVWAFCHHELMRLKDGSGVRPDKLVCEINKVLNGNSCMGAGPLKFTGLSSVAPIDNFWGKLLHYRAMDWNSPSASKRDLRGPRRNLYG